MTEKSDPLPDREAQILADMAQHQTWGFMCPALNFLVPFFFWQKYRSLVHDPLKRQAAAALLNFQLSWALYLGLLLILLLPAFFSPAWMELYQEYSLYNSGYSLYAPDFTLLFKPLLWLLIFLAAQFYFTSIWVAATLKIKNSYARQDYGYRGLLAIPFFREETKE